MRHLHAPHPLQPVHSYLRSSSNRSDPGVNAERSTWGAFVESGGTAGAGDSQHTLELFKQTRTLVEAGHKAWSLESHAVTERWWKDALLLQDPTSVRGLSGVPPSAEGRFQNCHRLSTLGLRFEPSANTKTTSVEAANRYDNCCRVRAAAQGLVHPGWRVSTKLSICACRRLLCL